METLTPPPSRALSALVEDGCDLSAQVGYIYFKDIGSGLVKIGYTGDLRDRDRSHRSSGLTEYRLVIRGTSSQDNLIRRFYRKANRYYGEPQPWKAKDEFHREPLEEYFAYADGQPWAASHVTDARDLPQLTAPPARLPWALTRGRYTDYCDGNGQGLMFTRPARLRAARPAADAQNSSLHDDYYTPADLCGSVRGMLGNIDLDPASCTAANLTVCADNYFTIEDNGLDQPWYVFGRNGRPVASRVFMNPPFGREAELFVKKLLWEMSYGNVKEAIVLLNAATISGVQWARPFLDRVDVVCMFDARHDFETPFDDPDKDDSGPNKGTALYYLWPRSPRFVRMMTEAFTDVRCYVKWQQRGAPKVEAEGGAG